MLLRFFNSSISNTSLRLFMDKSLVGLEGDIIFAER
jgi:hypothetical protein